MKRILLTIGLFLFVITAYAQTGTGWGQNRKKEHFKDSTYFTGQATFAGGIVIYDSLDASDYFVKLLPDTTAFTASDTLELTHAHMVITLTATGDRQTVTIPPNTDVAFPVGTTINFIQTGAALWTFVAGSGVTLNAFPADSTTSDGLNAWVGLFKRATDKWQLYGNIGN